MILEGQGENVWTKKIPTKNENQPSEYKKSNPIKSWVNVMIFLVGLGIFSYPIVSNIIYERAASSINQNYDAEVVKIDDADIKARLKLADAFNVYLTESASTIEIKDPFTKEEKEAGVAEYARMLEVNEQIGHVVIPKIGLDAPLYTGTSQEVLQRGLGHMEGTSLPVGGNNTHSVITGHRGLPSAKLFRDMDKLEIGDRFYVKDLAGTLAYQVDQIKIVEPTDFSAISIVHGQDYCTLLTCTPYMINSQRLLVRGHRIEYVEAVVEKDVRDINASNMYKNLFYIALSILIVLLSYFLYRYIQRRRKSKINISKDADLNEKLK